MEQGFYVVLSYQGNEYNVEIENPNRPLRDLIINLVTRLELPHVDGGGNPATYYLGRSVQGQEEILQARVKGEEMTLMDYDVKSGDRITLTILPIAG